MPLLLLPGFLAVFLAGCSQGAQTFSASTAPLKSTVADSDSTQAGKTVDQFAATLKHSDYAALRQMMSPAAQAKMPSTLAAWLQQQHGAYQPLAGAADLQPGESQYLAHGKRLLVRVHFTGADKALYRTNFGLVRSNDGSWKIDTILTPTKPGRPSAGAAGAAVNAAPAH